MTDRRKQHIEENSASRWVEELSSVEAATDFRDRLKSDFAEGRLGEAEPQPHTRPRKRPAFGWWRWLLPAAATVALAFAVLYLNEGPPLRVAQVTGEGDLRIGGNPIDMGDTEALNAAIGAGGDIKASADARIDLLSDDVMLVEVTGGTRMSIPKMPGRWFGRAAACSLYTGEMRIKTGKDFSGSRLAVFTPEGRVEITGTLLSIQRDEGGTCVCVLEGVAHVGEDENDMQAVEPGHRKVMFSDGRTAIMPVKAMHRDGVLEFDRRIGAQIESDP